MLIDACLDRVYATNLLSGTEPAGQRPTVQERRMHDQRSSSRSAEDQGAHKSAQSGSQFREQLDSLTTKVEGNASYGLTPSKVSQMSESNRDWSETNYLIISY